MISTTSTVVAADVQVSADLGGEAVILDLESGVYYGLNEVGTRIWTLIQTPKTVAQLRQILLDEYEVDPARCERELLALLNDLAGRGLVEIRNGTHP